MTNFSGPALLLWLTVLSVSACAGAPPRASTARTGDRLWVLAPHPDDEVLIAGELIRQAVSAHRPISILVMTNGDLGCERNGYAREAETIAALAILGVPEADVRFLGYPDGFLELLGPVALEPIARAAPDGTCGAGTGTYAVRGAGGADVHALLFGSAGAYVEGGPVGDLAELLRREQPSEIVVTHPIDTHRDHAMTYVFLRRALESAQLAVTPRILRAVVHQGPCWPNGSGGEPCPPVVASTGPVPAFAPPLDAYLPSLRVLSDDGGLTKRRAIAAYTSQLGTPIAAESWLSSFGRADEVFWPETLVRDPVHPERLVRDRADHVTTVRADVALGPGGNAFFELGGVRLTIAQDRVRLSEGERLLRALPWAFEERSTDRHTFELRVDERSGVGEAVEITVRRDGVLRALAVIARNTEQLRRTGVVSGAVGATIELAEVRAE